MIHIKIILFLFAVFGFICLCITQPVVAILLLILKAVEKQNEEIRTRNKFQR